MVKWVEPDDNGLPVERSCTIGEAIATAQAAAALHGYTYANERDALDDFLAVHWAWIDERG